MTFYLRYFLWAICILFLSGCVLIERPFEMMTLKEECSKENAESCRSVGARYHPYENEYDPNNKEDYIKAEFYYQKACDLKSLDACVRISELYEKGYGVEKNDAKMLEYYQKACDLKGSERCLRLAEYHRDKKNDFKMLEYYQKSCDFKNYKACSSLASYYNKQDANQDISRAVGLYEKICNDCESDYYHDCEDYNEIQKTACLMSALRYDDAIGQSNTQKAQELYQKACYPQRAISCSGSALSENDNISSVAFYEKACHENDGAACNNLGFLYQNGINFPLDKEKAIALYQKACDLKNSNGCYNFATIFERDNGDILNGSSDTMFGRLFISKEKIDINNNRKNNLLKINKIYRKACDLKNAGACYALGESYCKYKLNNIEYVGYANKYYKKACKLKYVKDKVNSCEKECDVPYSRHHSDDEHNHGYTPSEILSIKADSERISTGGSNLWSKESVAKQSRNYERSQNDSFQKTRKIFSKF